MIKKKEKEKCKLFPKWIYFAGIRLELRDDLTHFVLFISILSVYKSLEDNILSKIKKVVHKLSEFLFLIWCHDQLLHIFSIPSKNNDVDALEYLSNLDTALV